MFADDARYVLTTKGREAIGLPITVADLVDVWGAAALRWADNHLEQILFSQCFLGMHSSCGQVADAAACECECHV